MTQSLTRSKLIYKALNPSGDPFYYDPTGQDKLELIGLTLWLTEGDCSQLSLANGNPSIIKKYLEFLRDVCHFREEKIKAVIHCHDTLSYQECIDYWSSLTGIPPHRFNKPYIKKDIGGTRKYPYGILRIVAFNVNLLRIFNERLQNYELFRG